MAGSANNVLISPVNVLWRIEASEQIDFTGATAAGLGGTSFDIFLPDGTEYYVWFDENNTDVDPAPGGVAIEVNYGAGAVSTAIATAAASAIDGTVGFNASASGNVVTVYRDDFGAVTDISDNDSGLTLTTCREGKDFDLGLLQGDVELSLAPANFVVQAHQTGVTPRAALFQGLETNEATTVLLETQKSKLKEIYDLYGETFTPASGTEVTGIGTSRQGDNLLVRAARLVFKPVNATNDEDNTTIMLAVPVPDSLVFSGENPRTLSITWQGFIDDQIDTRASAYVIGDETQDGLRV